MTRIGPTACLLAIENEGDPAQGNTPLGFAWTLMGVSVLLAVSSARVKMQVVLPISQCSLAAASHIPSADDDPTVCPTTMKAGMSALERSVRFDWSGIIGASIDKDLPNDISCSNFFQASDSPALRKDSASMRRPMRRLTAAVGCGRRGQLKRYIEREVPSAPPSLSPIFSFICTFTLAHLALPA